MIHTFQIYVPFSAHELDGLQNRFGFSGYEINEPLHSIFHFAHFNIIKQFQSGMFYLSIHVDAVKLLDRSDIKEDDLTTIEEKLKAMIFGIFLHNSFYKKSFLVRIDYRFDVKVSDESKRLLLLKLFKKLSDQYKSLKKHLGHINDKGKYVAYETSVYHSSKSSGILSYDKESQCKSRDKEIKKCERKIGLSEETIGDQETENGICTLNIQPYEKEVLRFEIRLSKPHLDYKKDERKCKKVRPRTLEAYFKESVFHEHVEKLLLPIYFKGDFMKLSEARSIINKSPSLSPTMKKRLTQFLQKMNYSKATISSPLKNKFVSKPTFRKYLRELDKLNIHPVTIPKNVKGAPARIENPLKALIKMIEE